MSTLEPPARVDNVGRFTLFMSRLQMKHGRKLVIARPERPAAQQQVVAAVGLLALVTEHAHIRSIRARPVARRS